MAVSIRAEPRLTRDVDVAVAVADDRDAEACVTPPCSGYRVAEVLVARPTPPLYAGRVPTFDLYAELRAVVSALEARGMDYAVCGAVALAVHGKPRATTDIDILVHPDAAPEVKAVLRGLGYDLEAAPMTFANGIQIHRVSRVADNELFAIDLLLADPPLVEAWQDRVVLTWGDQPLRVVSRDALVSMKKLANRPQDRADLAALGELVEGDDG